MNSISRMPPRESLTSLARCRAAGGAALRLLADLAVQLAQALEDAVVQVARGRRRA
jgi:hypothetical protein